MKVSKRSGKGLLLVLGFILGFLALIVFLVVLPLSRFWTKAQKLKSLVRPVKDSLLLQDLPQLSANLQTARQEMQSLAMEYQRLGYLKLVPLLGMYYGDGQQLFQASQALLASSDNLVQAIMPYSAQLGFKGGNPQEPIVGGQERLAGVAKAAPAISDRIPEIKVGIHTAAAALAKIDLQRYPERLVGQDLRRNLNLLKDLLSYLDGASEDVKVLLDSVPDLLGEERKVSYLILFQNDKEIRPTGGFLTAYAVFTLEKGRIISVTSGDMYFLDIDNRVPFYPAAPDVIQKYLKIKNWYIRDANLSPDFKVSAQTIEEFWNRVPGVSKIDGIIAIDTHFVESLVGLLGEIQVPGYEKFTKDNITYQLELYSVVIGSKLEKRGGRKDLIGVLMQQILQKAFSQSSKQYGQFITKVWQEAVEKHILLYLHNDPLQRLAENYNFSGRVVDFEGDYLHVNDANFAGRKANWYVVEELSKNVVREGGRLISTLEINYENKGDYDPDLNTGYRDYVRVYVPKGSKLLDSRGSLNGTETLADLGKTVFASYIAVDPKKLAKLVLRYELPSELIKDGEYRLLVQKQPGTDRFVHTITAGKRSEKIELSKDTEVVLKF